MYFSLKTKIWLFVNITVLSFAVFIYLYFPAQQYKYFLNNATKEVQYIANTISTGVSIALKDENFQGIQTAMEYARADGRLILVVMYQADSAKGSKIVEKKVFRVYPEGTPIPPDVHESQELIVRAAAFKSEVMNGEISVAYSNSEILKYVNNLKNTILAVGLLLFVICSVLSYFISGTITKPLYDLRNASLQVGAGNLTFDVDVNRKDEVGDLGEAFNQMIGEIRKSRASLKKKNSQLTESNSELVRINQEKNDLIGIVSHDLKSPLNQVKGLLSLVQMSTTFSSDINQIFGMMNQSVDRMSKMISNILDVEAIESKQQNLKMERMDLGQLLIQSVSSFKHLADEKEITIQGEFSTGKHFVFADRDYCAQVLDNLLSNAIKFSPLGKMVHLTINTGGEFTELEVLDEGSGISKSDQKRLFLKYSKLSAKPTGGESSTGLGLSIVKRFAKMMEGDVYYDSINTKGAKFMLKLKTA